MPDEEVRVKATFKLISYSITVNNDGNGTAETNAPTATMGASVTLTATPNTGYEFDGWTTNPANLTWTDANTFTMPAGNVTVTASFKAFTPAVTFMVTGIGGTIAAKVDNSNITSGALVEYGKTVVFTATARVGYIVKEWTNNGESVNGTDATYTLANLTASVDVTVEFESGSVTGNGELQTVNPLKVWINNGILHVSGFAEGKMWKLYSVSGALVKQGIANSDTVTIPLEASGVYIIQSEGNTLKIVFN
jgi:uncharacterized repeat protein (TIGR02543 family)